jgi:hypothetical protein
MCAAAGDANATARSDAARLAITRERLVAAESFTCLPSLGYDECLIIRAHGEDYNYEASTVVESTSLYRPGERGCESQEPWLLASGRGNRGDAALVGSQVGNGWPAT